MELQDGKADCGRGLTLGSCALSPGHRCARNLGGRGEVDDMPMRSKMTPFFQTLKGGLFESVNKADVGDNADKM